jgi:hypothetical protein
MSKVQWVTYGKMLKPASLLISRFNLLTRIELCSRNTSIKSSRILKWNAGVRIFRRLCHFVPINCRDNSFIYIYFFWLYSPIQVLVAYMKLSVSLPLLDLGQSVGLLGRVISSSQGLYLYTNTEKCTHNTNIKHPCPEWDSNPRFRRPLEQRQVMP